MEKFEQDVTPEEAFRRKFHKLSNGLHQAYPDRQKKFPQNISINVYFEKKSPVLPTCDGTRHCWFQSRIFGSGDFSYLKKKHIFEAD